MAIVIKPGLRLFSPVDPAEFVVVKAPDGAVELAIGGVEVVTVAPERAPATATSGDGALIGKRYVDESGDVELLCTKAGSGIPAIGETPLRVKDAKPLPASD